MKTLWDICLLAFDVVSAIVTLVVCLVVVAVCIAWEAGGSCRIRMTGRSKKR